MHRDLDDRHFTRARNERAGVADAPPRSGALMARFKGAGSAVWPPPCGIQFMDTNFEAHTLQSSRPVAEGEHTQAGALG